MAFYPFANDPVQIINAMFSKTKEISAMTYNMKKTERIGNKMHTQESAVKLNLKPFKVYLKQNSPQKGLEVLYVQGENDNRAIVNTNGFPWINVHLDPMGNIMRDNQHHTIYQSGFGHLMNILEHLTSKYQKQLGNLVANRGVVVFDGNPCFLISFSNPYFNYYKYTVKKGETVLSIASKERLSEHMIMEKNPNIKDYHNIKMGQIIVLPNDYSPKLDLYVDKSRLIPLVMKVYDDKGLYEYYEYTKVNLNPNFAQNEFDQDNPNYGF